MKTLIQPPPRANFECNSMASAGLPVEPKNHRDNDVCPDEFSVWYCYEEHTATVFCSSMRDLNECRVKNCVRRCTVDRDCREFCVGFKFPTGVCYNNYCDCRAIGSYGIGIDHSLGTCTQDSHCKNFCDSSHYTEYKSVYAIRKLDFVNVCRNMMLTNVHVI